MLVRSCRDCANFEERRDIDGVALCAKHVGPYVSCEEFEPRDETINANKFYNKFCIECGSFEDVNGVPLCAGKHNPGVACEEFDSRFEKLNVTRQNNHMKAVLLLHTANNHFPPEIIPPSVAKIGYKFKW